MMTDTAYDVQGRIAELWIYPVKSCAGIAVPKAALAPWPAMGQALDGGRCQWRFLTQRSHPRMALIRPEITDEYLLLHFPGMDSLQIPLLVQGSKCRARSGRIRSMPGTSANGLRLHAAG
jgi:uncharacterized protein YcbX